MEKRSLLSLLVNESVKKYFLHPPTACAKAIAAAQALSEGGQSLTELLAFTGAD